MIDTPLGPLAVTVEGEAVVAVSFFAADRAGPGGGGEQRPAESLSPAVMSAAALLREAEGQLAAYFKGALQRFDLPLAPRGTAYQQRVWQALLAIGPGATTSYGGLAAQLGSVARAVGMANGQNPIAIIIPCHRVIGGDGSLTGYAGGLHRKRWLLRHEGALMV